MYKVMFSGQASLPLSVYGKTMNEIRRNLEYVLLSSRNIICMVRNDNYFYEFEDDKGLKGKAEIIYE